MTPRRFPNKLYTECQPDFSSASVNSQESILILLFLLILLPFPPLVFISFLSFPPHLSPSFFPLSSRPAILTAVVLNFLPRLFSLGSIWCLQNMRVGSVRGGAVVVGRSGGEVKCTLHDGRETAAACTSARKKVTRAAHTRDVQTARAKPAPPR